MTVPNTAEHILMTSKRDEYTKKMKAQLDELNAKIDAIEAKANEVKADAVEAYKAEVKKLRAQSKVAVDNFSEFKAAGEDSWDKMTAKMEQVRDAFVSSFHYFKSQV